MRAGAGRRAARLLVCLLAALAVFVATPGAAWAAGPVVRAVLFYSPTCPHCHALVRQGLPPILRHYGGGLQFVAVDASAADGQSLFRAAVAKYQVPAPFRGVPAVLIGDRFLAGTDNITTQLPALVDQYLASGGVSWPAVPGLSQTLARPSAVVTSSSARLLAVVDPPTTVLDRLARDRWGNTAALVVLGLMIAVVGAVLWRFAGVRRATGRWPSFAPGGGAGGGPATRAILALTLVGLGITGYLTYVRATGSTALCGSAGTCDIVQQSGYARLFGVLPVAYLGLAGYVAIAAVFAVSLRASARTASAARLALLLLTLGGTMFSIYLTSLEPFFIGATCVWCLGSAVTMTLLLLLSAAGATATAPAAAAELPSATAGRAA